MRLLRKILIFLIALIVIIAAALAILPWQNWLQQKLLASFTTNSQMPISYKIGGLGLSGLTLKDVSIGEPPLKLANLTVGYSIEDLRNKTINDISITGLTVSANKTDAGWVIDGTKDFVQPQTDDKPSTIPVTREQLNAIPLKRISIADSIALVGVAGWQVELPMQAVLENVPDATKLTFESSGITAMRGTDKFTSGKLQLELALDETAQQWRGTWTLDDITYETESGPIPQLSATGEVTLSADKVELTGGLSDASKTYYAAFALNYSLAKPETSILTITRANMAWGGGKISTSKVKLPIANKKPITVNVQVQKVEINALLNALTSNSATATGVVSGSLPIIIGTDGEIRIGKGSLKADQPGVIAMAPETIPGDNEQVAVVRDVLKNLHYQVLALNLDMAADNTVSVLLVLEGNNPDVQKGRAIKLQVHLSGDVLDLIKQNLKLMTDPQAFIEQETK